MDNSNYMGHNKKSSALPGFLLGFFVSVVIFILIFLQVNGFVLWILAGIIMIAFILLIKKYKLSSMIGGGIAGFLSGAIMFSIFIVISLNIGGPMTF